MSLLSTVLYFSGKFSKREILKFQEESKRNLENFSTLGNESRTFLWTNEIPLHSFNMLRRKYAVRERRVFRRW